MNEQRHETHPFIIAGTHEVSVNRTYRRSRDLTHLSGRYQYVE